MILLEIQPESNSDNTTHDAPWKLNNSLLENLEYKNKIKQLFQDSQTLRPAFKSTCEWWDDVKNRIKKISISIASKIKKQNREKETKIFKALETEKDLMAIAQLKQDLAALQEAQIKAMAIRSKAEANLKDEKCTAYFFQKLKQNRNKKTIHKITDPDTDKTYTDIRDINKVFHKYYQKLFSVNSSNNQTQEEILKTFETNLDITHDNPVTFKTERIRQIIKNLKNNKTPGPDGLSTEFYKTFIDEIQHILKSVYTEILDKHITPDTMRTAITILIPKTGDKSSPSNYRPISLLNTDYKILASYINQTYLTDFLDDEISPEQLCAAPNRLIQNGTIMTRDLIQYLNKKHLNGYLVSLDQKKAFDMVDRDFLFKILAQQNLHPELIKLLKTLYDKVTTRLQINGNLSEKIHLDRGVRQGCPLSATLYVVYVQSFINLCRRELKGIPIQGSKNSIKISAYADDLLVFCNTENEINKIFKCFDTIKDATGSELNKNKTRILAIGNPKPHEYSQLYTNRLTVCGVTFTSGSYEEIAKENENEIMTKTVNKIEKLKSLQCSMKGKILLCNTVIFPILLYRTATILPTKAFFKKYKKMIFGFLYGEGRREVFSRKIVELDVAHAGAGLQNIENRCNSSFILYNIIEPLRPFFSHQREPLFRYLTGLKLRKWFPETYNLKQPYAFEQLAPYNTLKNIELDRLKENPDVIKQPNLNKTLECLTENPERAAIKCPGNIRNREKITEKAIKRWGDYEIPTCEQDLMWRVAMRGLKTGEFVTKYGIPGMRTECVFCDGKDLETIEHILVECGGLVDVRKMLLKELNRVGSGTNDYEALLCLGVMIEERDREIERKTFRMTAGYIKSIWTGRNNIVFSPTKVNQREINNEIERIKCAIRFNIKNIENENQ